MTERRAAEEAIGHGANPAPAKGLPRPDWDSGNVLFSPLQPGDPPEWRTLKHNLGSTKLLVDSKFGGENSQGAVEWFVPAQTLFRFPDSDTVMIRWTMQQDEFERFGLVARPRVRLALWRW